MRININGKGMEVSDYMQEVIEKRVSKLDKYFQEDIPVHIMVSMFRGRNVVEITIPFRESVVLRAEEATGDLYASVDNACKKIESQIKKYHTRLEKRYRGSETLRKDFSVERVENDVPQEDIPAIVRTKRFAIKPMSLEEAAMQMELLGHAFFVFSNAETGEINVLYQRRDGNLGLIEPEFE